MRPARCNQACYEVRRAAEAASAACLADAEQGRHGYSPQLLKRTANGSGHARGKTAMHPLTRQSNDALQSRAHNNPPEQTQERSRAAPCSCQRPALAVHALLPPRTPALRCPGLSAAPAGRRPGRPLPAGRVQGTRRSALHLCLAAALQQEAKGCQLQYLRSRGKSRKQRACRCSTTTAAAAGSCPSAAS